MPRKSFQGDLQIAWDNTSLTLLMACPRKYHYSMILSRAPRSESVHLTFGILFHQGMEWFYRLRAEGLSHDEAVHEVTGRLLVQSHGWKSDDTAKNRPNLIRSVVWALDHYRDDPSETVLLASGKPAVELSFRFDLPIRRPDGEPYQYSGHIDRLAQFQGDIWVHDYKSTKQSLGDFFFAQFSPNNQMSGYTFGAKVTYHQPVRGVIIDGVQVLVEGTRFARRPTIRSDSQLNEWIDQVQFHIKMGENYAAAGSWPMNLSACGMYGGCPFREICSKPPAQRQAWLEADFVPRVWDPLAIRGDI